MHTSDLSQHAAVLCHAVLCCGHTSSTHAELSICCLRFVDVVVASAAAASCRSTFLAMHACVHPAFVVERVKPSYLSMRLGWVGWWVLVEWDVAATPLTCVWASLCAACISKTVQQHVVLCDCVIKPNPNDLS